ncbi:MAG: 30S ribosomal protein S8e [Thermoproteota archaeon]|nr:30S ribosomal protein S8e [Thermoproteota archaeon]
MVIKHSNDLVKPSGGKKSSSRKTRRYELGGFPVLTTIGEREIKKERVYGGNYKIKLLKEKFANVLDPKTGKVQRVEILDVIKNPANVDYDRRKIITKGAIIRTKLGEAIVTSRPGQDGIINAKLITK